MIELYLILTCTCIVIYSIWFFWPKITGNSCEKFGAEEYA